MADQTLEQGLRSIIDTAQKILAGLPQSPAEVIVSAGGDLQAACDAGGTIRVNDEAAFGPLVLRTPGTRLIAPKASLRAPKGQRALFVPPGAKDIQAVLGPCQSDDDQYCVLVGSNDPAIPQKTADAQPDGIQLTLSIPSFRGKHALGIHAKNWALVGCDIRDVWNVTNRESQAVGGVNGSGPGRIAGGYFEAASECILFGGDTPQITGMVMSDVVIEDVTMGRPLAWRTDGIDRGNIKTIFEAKALRNAVLRRCILRGNWKAAQPEGFAVMLTPRNGLPVQNIALEDCEIFDVASGVRLIGFDDSSNAKPGPQASGIRLTRVIVRTDPALGAGARPFLEITGQADDVLVEESRFSGAGTTVYTGPGPGWDAQGNRVQGQIITRMRLLRNAGLDLRSYGIMTNGNAYGAKWQEAWPDGQISGNVFTNVASGNHRKNLPADNTFLAGDAA